MVLTRANTLLGPRVELFMYGLEPLFINMRIYLRSGNIGMPQHLLDRAQISPPLKQVRGETVP